MENKCENIVRIYENITVIKLIRTNLKTSLFRLRYACGTTPIADIGSFNANIDTRRKSQYVEKSKLAANAIEMNAKNPIRIVVIADY